MKLKSLLLILVVFFILKSVSSPYKKKPAAPVKPETYLNVWPAGVNIYLPSKPAPELKTYYTMLKNYINQLKSSKFTKSYYDDKTWYLIMNDLQSFQTVELANFVNIQNKYTNVPNVFSYCEYLNPLYSFSQGANVFNQALTAKDPGMAPLITGEYTFLTLPFTSFVKQIADKSPC